MNCPTEHAEQVQIVNWLDFIAVRKWPDLAIVDGWAIDNSKYSMKRPQWRLPYFAVPNGGNRNPITAAKLKAEGTRAGVQDLAIMIPRRDYPGLLIEMKRIKGGTVDKAQRVWRDALRSMGYFTIICKGHQQAIDVITKYLNLGRSHNEKTLQPSG